MAARDSKNDPDRHGDGDGSRSGPEPIPQGGVTEKDDAPEGRLEQERVIPELTRQDFMTRPIEELADRTGLTPPESGEDEGAWREKAWENHAQDLANRDEWGTATQVTEPPEGEDPNL